ncbi:uncharacterized protein LOC121559763 [Tachysurus ichikawai]
MLFRVQFREEQKYIKLQPDIKVYDQSDTKVDTEVFEEIVKESPGTLRIKLGNGGLVPHDHHHARVHLMTVILNFMMCDPVEEEADAEGSQPKTLCHINYEAKADTVMYAQGIVALFPYLEDPYSQHGSEHYYDPESGSGYLAWRLKTIQRKTAEERGASVSKTPTVGGPDENDLHVSASIGQQ